MSADLAADGVGGHLAVVDAALVQVSDVDLHAGEVTGLDELVGP